MSNPTLKTNNSKIDTRVKEPSGVVPPPLGVGPGSPDRFNLFCKSTSFVDKNIYYDLILQKKII